MGQDSNLVMDLTTEKKTMESRARRSYAALINLILGSLLNHDKIGILSHEEDANHAHPARDPGLERRRPRSRSSSQRPASPLPRSHPAAGGAG